jgi:glycosyltransferase involved in cell wall biosynthesis
MMGVDKAGSPMTILLYGPPYGRALAGAYGGGTGGYARNMEVYLSSLAFEGATFEPLFYTVRGERGGLLGSFPMRMLVDGWRILARMLSKRPDAVHVLASYRKALPRELFLAMACRIMRVPLIYDVKAGAFIASYENGSWAYRAALACTLRSARAVLIEGRTYHAFLRQAFGIESLYFPNFVPALDVPADVPARLAGEGLKVLFAGYCFEDKGVRSLLEGCALAAASGLRIMVTLIGEEAPAFKAFADRFALAPSMTLRRLGRRPHAEVRTAMKEHDIYCYPSTHSGEGHNNSINEAMMWGMVIVATRQGFMADVLSESGAYFLASATAEEVAGALAEIAADHGGALKKAARARGRLMAEFTSLQANERLRIAYGRVLAATYPDAAGKIRSVPQ